MSKTMCPSCGGYGDDFKRRTCLQCGGSGWIDSGKQSFGNGTGALIPSGAGLRDLPLPIRLLVLGVAGFVAYVVYAKAQPGELAWVYAVIAFFVALPVCGIALNIIAQPVKSAILVIGLLALDEYFWNGTVRGWIVGDAYPWVSSQVSAFLATPPGQ